MTGRMFEKFKTFCKENPRSKIQELTLFPSKDYDWKTAITSIYGATLFDNILEVRTIKMSKSKEFLKRYINKQFLPTDFSVTPIERNYIKTITLKNGTSINTF